MNQETTIIAGEIRAKLKAELDAWQNGQRRLTVANQHDRYTLESALEAVSDDSIAAIRSRSPMIDFARCSAIDLAHRFSEFEAPEFSDAWVN